MNLRCEGCGAAIVLEASQRTAVCPYCTSPNVIERPPTAGLPNPAFVLGFAVGREAAQQAVRGWIRRQGIFTHGGIRTAPLEDLRGIYLPAYLYGALTRSQYAAEIGENYQTTETYTTFENGK